MNAHTATYFESPEPVSNRDCQDLTAELAACEPQMDARAATLTTLALLAATVLAAVWLG
jgi:hypothetical protein